MNISQYPHVASYTQILINSDRLTTIIISNIEKKHEFTYFSLIINEFPISHTSNSLSKKTSEFNHFKHQMPVPDESTWNHRRSMNRVYQSYFYGVGYTRNPGIKNEGQVTGWNQRIIWIELTRILSVFIQFRTSIQLFWRIHPLVL